MTRLEPHFALAAIAAALPALALALYTRVSRDRVLSHPVRAALHERLRAAEAVHAADLARASALHLTTVLYHLRRLESSGYIRSTVANGVTYWSLPERTPNLQRVRAQRTQLAQRVATSVTTAPGRLASEIATDVGADFHAVYYHLRKLAQAGVVSRVPRTGDRDVWVPSEPTQLAAATP